MPTKKEMLSVAEVYEMEPGTEDAAAWINPGFVATVVKIVRTQTKRPPRKDMFICTLKDDVNDKVEISMTLFESCPFDEGDVIEVEGKGLRRTEYNDLAQVSVGRETKVHKIGRSVTHEAKKESEAKSDGAPAGSSSSSASSFHGATVGMAVKESFVFHTSGEQPDVSSVEFWAAVYETASDIMRTCRGLEGGRLVPGVKERNGQTERRAEPAGEPDAAEKARKEAAEKARLAAIEAARKKEIEEDCPF